MVLRVSGFLAFTSSRQQGNFRGRCRYPAEGTTLDKFMLTFGKIQGRR